MKHFSIYIVALSLMVLSCRQGKQAAKNEIIVDASKVGATIPSSMYGVFFEEINHAGDGGIYAELIQNQSFEEKEMPSGYYVENGSLHSAKGLVNHISGESGNPSFRWNKEEFPGWSLKREGEAKTEMRLTKLNPLHAETPNSMQIIISSAKGTTALANSGYWGIACQKDQNYQLRFFLRAGSDYNGGVTAKLVSSTNQVLASQKFALISSGKWLEYTSTLKASETDSKATFALEFDAKETVFVDYISLFPEKTFKTRYNGLRADVAQALADLHPAYGMFLGALVEFDEPLQDEIFTLMMSLRDRSGSWAEYFKDDKPLATVCHPWSAGVNIEAAIKYVSNKQNRKP